MAQSSTLGSRAAAGVSAAGLVVALGAVAAVEVLFAMLGATGPVVALAVWTATAADCLGFPCLYLTGAFAAGYWLLAGAAVALLAAAVEL